MSPSSVEGKHSFNFSNSDFAAMPLVDSTAAADMQCPEMGPKNIQYSVIAPETMSFSNCQPLNIPAKISEYDDVARQRQEPYIPVHSAAILLARTFRCDLASADQCQNG